MNKLFKTPWTAMAVKTPVYEVNEGISQTVPDQSLTVREILIKYASGTVPDIFDNDPLYNEDFPDLRGLDISELHEMRREAQEDVKMLQNEINSRKSFKNQESNSSPTDPSPAVQPEKTTE